MIRRPASKLACAFGVALTLTALTAPPADARRGGSFGSRGMRTYQAPRPTQTAPMQTAPVQRSMSTAPRTAAQQPARPNAAAPAAAQAPRRGGMFGGFGGGLMGGLLAGGLIGALMGHGFGGGWGGAMGGMLTMLIQVAAIGLAVFLLMKLFRRRQQPQAAMAGVGNVSPFGGPPAGFGRNPEPLAPAYTPYTATNVEGAMAQALEIPVTPADRAAFERLLVEVQDAFGREDYAALRARTTPEIMSFLAEELSENAVAGHRNEVKDTRLLEADVAEAWREDDVEYATAAIRYESIDVMRDRTTGAVVEGNPDKATEATELWTFARQAGEWKLSAIQVA